MPLYADYECNECGNVFTYSKPYGEEFPKNPICTHCQSIVTHRKFSSCGIVIPPHMKAGKY